MELSEQRLSEIVRELVIKPGHDKVKAAIQELLVDGLGAERNHVNFEKRVPEAQGRIDAIIGRTAFGAEAEKVAAGVALPDNIHFQTARRRVREALAESGVTERIDALVARLLP